MRTFLGMILGCLLTIAFVYVHDVRASSSVANSTTGIERGQIVNWDVAAAEWNHAKDNVRQMWVKLTSDVKV